MGIENQFEKSNVTIENIVENLSTKFPKYAKVIAAFAIIFNVANASIQQKVEGPDVRINVENSVDDSASQENKTIQDLENAEKINFEEVVDNFEGQMKNIGQNIPENSTYKNNLSFLKINGINKSNEESSTGKLENRAENVVVNSDTIVGCAKSLDTNISNNMDGIKTAFSISPAENNVSVEKIYQVVSQGVGLSEDMARANGIDECASQIITKLHSESIDKLQVSKTSGEVNSSKELFSNTIHAQSKVLLKLYNTVSVETKTDSYGKLVYLVTVEASGGVISK
jgi:hypothetical protein